MGHIFRRKLLRPSVSDCLVRPRLLATPDHVRLLRIEAPAGSGKTVFLSQWLGARNQPSLWYELDEGDTDGQVFTAHLLAGLQALWPDWRPPAVAAPADLAAEIAAEASDRPPLDIALDRLEYAFDQPYLADFLAILLRYAPPTLTLALSGRAPLPLEAGAPSSGQRIITAGELAFTQGEADELLGAGDWQDCFARAGGLPLALAVWRQTGAGWQAVLTSRLVGATPPHLSPELGGALVREWLAGRMTLDEFAHQTSRAKPANTKLWRDLAEARHHFNQGEFRLAMERLSLMWEAARGHGDRRLSGAIATQMGEVCFGLGDYASAMAWYHTAFELEPMLEVLGPHTLVLILMHQGHLIEADDLGRRCVVACEAQGDLQALAAARAQWGLVLADLGRFDEAERELVEAERIGARLQGDPYFGILAMIHRASMESMRGNLAASRRIAEEAYLLAQSRSPWFTAMAGMILAGALARWGEHEQVARLSAAAMETFTRLDAKFMRYMMLSQRAVTLWSAGQVDAARVAADEALHLAAAEGYAAALSRVR